MEKLKAIFQKADDLAQLFTAPNELTFEEHECYRSNIEGDSNDDIGFSFAEYAENDIRSNLIAWSSSGESIYYVTPDFTYIFTLIPIEALVTITQFERARWIRKDSWLNLHSVGCGKEFLKDHTDKRIPMFVEG